MSLPRRVLILALCHALAASAARGPASLSGGLKMVRKIYDNCEKSEEIVKCLKIQAIKIADRAIKSQNIPIVDGLSVIKRSDAEGARALDDYNEISEDKARNLSGDQLDEILAEQAGRFFDSHQVKMSASNFFGKSGGKQEIGQFIEEGRGKLKKYMGPILTAIAIKGGFVSMAFQTIALIAAKALLIGKIALVLSAIIGLKKLVSGDEAHEKTTYEIVKHPQVSQSHSYSSAHYGGGEFEASGPGGHYRSLEKDEIAQDRAYRSYVPRS